MSASPTVMNTLLRSRKFHTLFLPELASRFHETPSLVLSVRKPAGFQGQHNAHVFLCRRRSVNFREIRACIHCEPRMTKNTGTRPRGDVQSPP